MTPGALILLRGTARGPAYVRRAIGCTGMVSWTDRRDEALRLATTKDAHDLQEAAALRYGIAVAVVPA